MTAHMPRNHMYANVYIGLYKYLHNDVTDKALSTLGTEKNKLGKTDKREVRQLRYMYIFFFLRKGDK